MTNDAYERGKAAGREEERADAVAWLRGVEAGLARNAEATGWALSDMARTVCAENARHIALGTHVGAAKKVRERFVHVGAVRRERHTAEERAVVEAAMAFVAAPVFDMAVMLDLTAACAALRAKRGG
jgi:hypothetical protein